MTLGTVGSATGSDAARPRHLVSSADLDAATTLALLDHAVALRDERRDRTARGVAIPRGDLGGRTVALVFEKPSTRTRVSFEVAVTELGGAALPLSAAELQLGRGESVADTGAVLSRYVHGIVVRTFGQDRLEELAASSTVPVVNALTDLEHPCQALADLLTVRDEFGTLTGRRLAYVGDGNNVAHSLLIAGATVGLDVAVAHPPGYDPDPAVVALAQERARAAGSTVLVTEDPRAAVDGADALYTDVWTSMGQEEEAQERRRAFADHVLDAALLARAAPHAIVLHCLPAHRGEEIAAEVLDGPASRVLDQAENRLHVQKAVLAYLIAPAAQGAP